MLDAETKVAETPGDHKDELRLWLRLLTCTTLIEGEVRRRLRERFDVTLPRFDLMAQLDRAEEGMTLGELSRRMMVTNGNVPGLVERLVEEGALSRGRRRATAALTWCASPTRAAASFAGWRRSMKAGLPLCSRA
jgi:DNA-binding MarR family transcriptional regulator